LEKDISTQDYNNFKQKSIHIVVKSATLSRDLFFYLSDKFTLTSTDCTLKSLDMLYNEKPDLILLGLDFKFPFDTNSYIKIITSHTKFSTTPLLLIGENQNLKNIEAGLKNGATDFVMFPFIESHLIHRLNTNIFFNKHNGSEFFKSSINNFISFEDTFRKKFTDIMNAVLFEKPPNIDVIAKLMSMSVSSLERYCKLYFNTTPNKYIINLKLEASISMLKKNNGNVKYVSNFLCFSSVPYFCFCFKNKFQYSPKKYINKSD